MAKRCGRGREGEQKKMKMVNLFTFEYGKTKDGKENLSEHRSKKEKKKRESSEHNGYSHKS